ncbi:MAG TPA: PilN domain-containing protein [Gemmatimonadales bacterium]|nr:PilN domain-containing protein [Gemmatimonadales bacterium]
MITVNLRPGKRRKSSGSPLDFKGMFDGFRNLGVKVKDPLLLAAVGAWVCVLGFLGFIYLNNVRQLLSLEPRLEHARSENKRFKTFLADKRRQEQIRDSLLAQITVIRDVDGDRYIWPHLLDEVTKALPAYTWLVDLGTMTPMARPRQPARPARPAKPAKPGTPGAAKADSAAADTAEAPLVFQLNGRTIDIQAYTRFLRQLEASPWIHDVVPVMAQTVVEQERPVTAFTIKASYRVADSAYIRTAPFSQSVR